MQNPLSPDEEHTLLLQIRTTPDAFQALYRHYFPRVFAYTAYRVGSKQDAEDLTAAIFVKLIQAITHFEYRGAGSFATWLFRIARNEVQQHYRAQYRRATTPLDDLPDIESTDLPPDEVFNRKQQFLRLHEFILTLSPRRQEIITLRYFGGLRNQEIAAVLSLDERTIASHLSRGLDDLKQLYQKEDSIHE
jgi:RNA polymerase sigma-70 factor (ECF subfamily)